MNVLDLADIDATMIELVGGKAAGLGEMIRAGERVPPGFCLTTTDHEPDALPEDEILAAYHGLGSGRVAVRSSATTEDLPWASSAGQQDTLLNVEGASELVDAIRKCRGSLRTERAVAYREASGIDAEAARMAVVVQRMIDPAVAGVLFTANPITNCRTEMVLDAAPGLGTAVVDGTVTPDHYVLSEHSPAGEPRQEEGCVGRERREELRRAGARLQARFGCPQDIEWAIDQEGELWLLQTRPITTLFPPPPETDRPLPRVYLEFGHVQGMLRPFTPMGMSVLKLILASVCGSFGVKVDPVEGPSGVVAIGGRLYGDLTDLVRNERFREKLPRAMAVDFGPRAQAVVERVLADPRFFAQPGRPLRVRTALSLALRTAPRAVAEITRTLARPDAARSRVFRAIEEIRHQASDPTGLHTPAQRLDFVENTQGGFLAYDKLLWPMMTGMLMAAAPVELLKGIAGDAEVNAVLRGLPHNVTTEMDLALWRLAEGATEHRELLLNTPPGRLARMYRAGGLPDIGLAGFLADYGHRAAAEIDIGVPRWEEDPTPVLAAIANYLRVTDPEQSPERRFARAAAEGEATLAELARRARRARPIRGWLAGFCMRRARALAGLREAGKFAGLYPLRQTRRQLLLVGAELAGRGLLERAADIMFLTLAEARAAVERGADHRALVTSRRAIHDRETRRPTVPVAVLSDGTDVEAIAPPESAGDGTLRGMAAAAGRATGPARVVRDPAGAHVEPGEILVTPTTDPGWTPLFLTAGALVTETGAPMAHGPTVAREYGIPAVICVRDATWRIETGQVITVDGAAGTVTVDPGR